MKYHGVYEVDPDFLDGNVILWKNTGNGEYIIATKGGKKYFVKRNMHARYPTRGVSKAVYQKYKAEADALQKKQEKLRGMMKELDWTTDHIVAEQENFWDGEKMFTTVTPLIPDVLSDTYDYTALSLSEFVQLAKSASKTLEKLHAHKVIHGDVKNKNILVSNKGGNYVAYLIDFDSSYPADEIPEWTSIGGSDGYQSPEVILYGSDESAASKDTITTATDIFSLGVVFHKWWTGFCPGVDMERGSVGAAVYLDKTVTIDKKFDVCIGDTHKATLKSLLNWMFAKEPQKRPSAKQVFEVLDDKLGVGNEFCNGNDVVPFDNELWESHQSIAELLPVSELQNKGVKSLKRFRDGNGDNSLKYRVVFKDDAEQIITVSELLDKGYAVVKGVVVEEPWDNHMIEFESVETIAKKGYSKICRSQSAIQKRYEITVASGGVTDHGVGWLIAMGLAHPKTVLVDADTPWPEHGTDYNVENMSRHGVKSISRVEVGGEHRYRIVYYEVVDGKNKVNENVHANNVKLMGFLK